LDKWSFGVRNLSSSSQWVVQLVAGVAEYIGSEQVDDLL